MTGEYKSGRYRIIANGEVRFFRVRHNSEDKFIIEELKHVYNQEVTVKDSKKLLTAAIWEELETWQ